MDCNFIGKFAYYFLPYRKKVIKKNMKIVFKDTLSAKETKKFIQEVYAHYIRAVIMIFRTHFFYTNAIKKPLCFIGEENLLNAHKQKKGVIILCGHIGDFQLGVIKGVHKFFNLKFYIVLKAIQVQWLEKIFYSGIKSCGAQIISAKGGVRKKVLSVLEQGDIAIFAFDQHAKIDNNKGVVADFFGQKAGSYSSLAELVQKTEARVIPVVCYFAKKSNKNIMEFLPEVKWQGASSPEEEILLNTFEYNKALEQMILKSPTQWMWTHKRWKIDEKIYD